MQNVMQLTIITISSYILFVIRKIRHKIYLILKSSLFVDTDTVNDISTSYFSL